MEKPLESERFQFYIDVFVAPKGNSRIVRLSAVSDLFLGILEFPS